MKWHIDDITSMRRKRGSSAGLSVSRVVSKASSCLHAFSSSHVFPGGAMQVKNNNNITGQDALSNLGALFVF
ncbi:MAG: hypothetical protein K2M63_01660 [Muribaculaceae bacterium]|nr:hypothetical protein [Bacteroides sp.]MDE6226208.1 hypothetical protein [Muribaculaceae bacterium]